MCIRDRSGVVAEVFKVDTVTSTDPDTLYVKYVKTGTNNTATKFTDGETITSSATDSPTAVVASSHTGSSASVVAGNYYFNGFFTIKSFIKTKSKKGLLWIFAILAFILSAIIDNLTATIVLITILKKVIPSRETRLWFAGLIIIAANAGGAWSPIGDVTTTMLWIANKVTTGKLIGYVLIPSIVCLVVPTFLASTLHAFKGEIALPDEEEKVATHPRGAAMLYLGLSAIIFVPIFKTLTHLPPYVGMMLSLAIVATFAEIFSKAKISISSVDLESCLLYTSPSPRDATLSRMPSSA